MDKGNPSRSKTASALSVISDFAMFSCENQRPRLLDTRAWMISVVKAMDDLNLLKDIDVKGSKGLTIYSYAGIKTCESGLRKFGLLKFGQCGIEESAHVEMVKILKNSNHKADDKRVMEYFARKWPIKYMMLTGKGLIPGNIQLIRRMAYTLVERHCNCVR